MIAKFLKYFNKSTLAFHYPPIAKASNFLLLTKINYVHAFTKHHYSNKESSESLLKQYFSSRLSLSTSQLEAFIVDLSKIGDVKIKDHRWQNLCSTIEKYQNQFSFASKIQILRCLGRMKQDNALFMTIYKNVVAEFHRLTTNQISDLIWSMIRVGYNDKAVIMAIYKKLYQIIKNKEKIVLYKQSQRLPLQNYVSSSLNDQQTQKIHHIYEGNFVRLIWALSKTTIIDNKLIVSVLKYAFQDMENLNIQKIRLENLSLLGFCIFQVQIQKYRVTDSIISQIMNLWEELPSLSILSLSLMCQTFSKFIKYKTNYIERYQKEWIPEQIEKNQKFLQKQKKFLYFIIQTIFLRQDQDVDVKRPLNKEGQEKTLANQQDVLKRLKVPLSGKFASKILYNLARVGMYDNKIWYKLLKSITDDVDHVEAIDLSMSLCAVCDFGNKEFIPHQDYKNLVYNHKKIITRRMFQIYNSLSGRTLLILKEFIHKKKVEKELVPTWIRKEVEKQFSILKAKEQLKASQEFTKIQINSQNDDNHNMKLGNQFSPQAQSRQDRKRKKNSRRQKSLSGSQQLNSTNGSEKIKRS